MTTAHPGDAVATTSEVIDVARSRLLRIERLRLDIVAYRRVPSDDAEVELAPPTGISDLDDATDWEALYPDDG